MPGLEQQVGDEVKLPVVELQVDQLSKEVREIEALEREAAQLRDTRKLNEASKLKLIAEQQAPKQIADFDRASRQRKQKADLPPTRVLRNRK